MPDKNQKQRKAEGNTPVPAEAQAFAEGLAAQIKDGGPITVAQFMAHAAGHYYANKPAFGAEGDFITAPDISQMFGEMIGAWLVDLWLQMGRPEKVNLIELGPGRGTLMADIMRTVSSWPDFKTAVSIHLVEASPRLRQIQSDALRGHSPTWHDHFHDVPAGFSFVLANEFFDALPIHQFRKSRGQWLERAVGYDNTAESFVFTTVPAVFTTVPAGFDIASVMPPDFVNAHDGAIFEISPDSLEILENICRRIAGQGGAALIVDYGHSAPGLGDTLQSMQNHQYCDVLENPGARDITAHVDFGTFRTAAMQHAKVLGPAPQGEFLRRMGIQMRAESLRQNATEEQRRDITTALHRLTSPAEMGHLFKVMGIVPADTKAIPAGFSDDHTSDIPPA